MKKILLFTVLLISIGAFAQSTKTPSQLTQKVAAFNDSTIAQNGTTQGTTLQSIYNLFGVANKLTSSDTSFLHAQIVQLLNAKLNSADTSLLHAQIAQTVSAIATKLNIADTSFLHNQIAQAVAAIAANTIAIAGKQGALTLTTNNTSGAATLTGNTLNIPNYATGGGSSTTLTDNLTTSTTGTALDAHQGFVLKGLIDGNTSAISGKQPLENQRLSTTNTPTFAGLTSNGITKLIGQSGTPTAPAVGTQNMYADSTGAFTIQGSNGFALAISKNRMTANRRVYVQDKDYTVGDSAVEAANTAAITKAQGLINLNAKVKKDFGLLIPQFKTVNKFDNISGTLSTTQLAIHSSGIGLVSATGGTNADGYLKLPAEVEGRNATRSDWLIAWDATETGASMTVGIGDAATGYMITIANTGGNVVVTWPSGATVTGALTGTVNLSVSIATGNMGITCSVQVLGTPAALANTNPYRVPVWEYAKCTKTKLWHAYFKTNTTSSKIVGFLHNMKNWNGDPTGQLLTRTMLINAAGFSGANGSLGGFASDHDNMIIIPERTSLTTPLKVADYFHGRTLTYKSIIDITLGDFGEGGRQLLAAGYALIATSGGSGNTNMETDYWGNATGLSRASEVYDALQNNVSNVGKEYLIGWSMGGVSASNYLRMNPERVGAVWLSCPVMDLEETGNSFAVQTSAALKTSVDNAYMNWFYCIGASITTDPQTDNGTGWRQASDPGGLPPIGLRNYTIATVSTAQTAQSVIPLSSGTRIYPGDYIYFKWSGQMRQVGYQAIGVPNSIVLDVPVTVAASEPVSIIRPDNRYGYDYAWVNRVFGEWTAGTYSANTIVRRKSVHPELDVRPYNPARFADFYAEMAVPFHIMVGGDGTSTGNDGILNNAPMFAFASAVNAITPGVVTMVIGSGGHVSTTNISYSDMLSLFNAN